MEMLSRPQKARTWIRGFRTITEALLLRGYYKPCGESGRTLEMALRTISPDIYGLMNDPQRVELDGLIYVIDRLPTGIEECTRITLSTIEGLSDGFSKIMPLKRRRTSYKVSEKEMCFEIARGRSEIFDLITHLTFLYIEARKICNRGYLQCEATQEWLHLEEIVRKNDFSQSLDQEIWNLSKILGRTFNETKNACERLSVNRETNNGLFKIVYWLGKRAREAEESKANEHMIIFTPSLMIDNHRYGERWANVIKETLLKNDLQDRELHIISANMHSIINLLYGPAVVKDDRGDIYTMAHSLRTRMETVKSYAKKHGCHYLPDQTWTHIDCQLIDTAGLKPEKMHPDIPINPEYMKMKKPVLLVMDYAFGEQAFQVMDELLKPYPGFRLNVKSVSVMGKAGILKGDKGDIMLPTAHVFEGITDTYPCDNQIKAEDFENGAKIYRGSMITVPGTSLQNEDILTYFVDSSWHAIGLEMEGGHYQKAVQSAILRGHIPGDVTVRYAYYASDNPLRSGQTLASGGMGEDGIKPAYMITKVILGKILKPEISSKTDKKISVGASKRKKRKSQQPLN